MEGGQTVLYQHEDGHVAVNVHKVHQQTRQDGKEVADGENEASLGTVGEVFGDGRDAEE